MIPYENQQVFFATEPMDLRMSIDGLSNFIQHEINHHLYDGAIYVFYNRNRDKVKCLFWDRNGFVLHYKRLDKCKFKIKEMLHKVEQITFNDLEILLSGFDPQPTERHSMVLEHRA